MQTLTEQLAPTLLRWYDEGVRAMPWRCDPQPYRVFVSEIMLQQTRVEAATPYFLRFVEQLPTVSALAAADEEQLLKLWEGLGYYNRVRNMQRAAQRMVEQYGGELPADFEALRSLPGIGDYTAGAIASIAFGLRHPAVDGNVLRVFARLLCSEADIASPAGKRELTAVVEQCLPHERVGDFNQALMELGAMVCLPNGRPLCESCPAGALCAARAQARQEELPVKTPKKARRVEQRTVLILMDERGRIALRKRPEGGLLAGLWEPVALEGRISASVLVTTLRRWGLTALPQPLPGARHIFTHVEWRMKGWCVQVPEDEKPTLQQSLQCELHWVPADRHDGHAVPAAYAAYVKGGRQPGADSE